MMSSRTGWWTSTRCTAISNSPALWPPSGSGRGCGPASPIWPSCVANDSSLDLRRQMVALASASRAPFSAAAMVQEHLYLLLQCPEAEALRGYALDTEAALGECRLPAGVSALCTDIGQLIRVLGEAAAAQGGLLLHRRRGGALLRHLRPAPH